MVVKVLPQFRSSRMFQQHGRHRPHLRHTRPELAKLPGIGTLVKKGGMPHKVFARIVAVQKPQVPDLRTLDLDNAKHLAFIHTKGLAAAG